MLRDGQSSTISFLGLGSDSPSLYSGPSFLPNGQISPLRGMGSLTHLEASSIMIFAAFTRMLLSLHAASPEAPFDVSKRKMYSSHARHHGI